MKHLALLVLFAVASLAQPALGGRGGKSPAQAKPDEPFAPKRLADGHLDFHGIWMAASLSAAFNVEEHEAKYGTPAGPSVIVDPPGGKLPYLPGMREIANDNDAHRERDPVGQRHMHGVPRVMFPPFPLEILQDGPYVVILTETEHGVRIIPTDGRPFLNNYSSWNGDSRGHWEGDTLVVEVRGLNGKGWLDQAGNFVGEGASAVERFRLTGKDTIEVLERPFTVRVELKRHTEPDFQLVEHECDRDAKGVYRHPAQFLKGLTP